MPGRSRVSSCSCSPVIPLGDCRLHVPDERGGALSPIHRSERVEAHAIWRICSVSQELRRLAVHPTALLIAYAPVYTFLHLEVRYFHQVKISALALAMMMGAALWSKWKKRQGRTRESEGTLQTARAM
jgi:hypothetical protein